MPRTNTVAVTDSDGHVIEPDDLWATYLDAGFLPSAPRWVSDTHGRRRRLIGGRLQPYIPFPQTEYTLRPVEGAVEPGARISDMDRHGIQVSVLFPSAGLHFASIPETEVAIALCRAYNDWLADFCATDRTRLVGVALLPQLDVAASIAEARRAVTELGFKGVMLRPNPVAGRTLDNPAFDPLWSVLEELDVAVGIHEATTMNVQQAGTDRYDNYMFLHVISHPHEHQMACLSLICGGVLERHPGLRVAFLEAGCGWVPYWLERMDQHMRYWGGTSTPLPLAPSDYFRRQCFVSPVADEQTLPDVARRVGADCLIFTSDYPYPYTTTPRIADAILGRDDLDDDVVAAVVRDNAARLYGFAT
jgi:predicted TIM-barrel fold metal-dependent hydrolase